MSTTNLSAVIFDALQDENHPRRAEVLKAINNKLRFPIMFYDWRKRYDDVCYLVADDGCVWKGPVSPEDNMHWARMEGVSDKGEPVWVTQRSDPPVIIAYLDDDAVTRLYASTGKYIQAANAAVKPVDAPIPSLDAALEELRIYCGTPKCCDCKWKSSSPIAQNCECQPGQRPDAKEKQQAAFDRARALQSYVFAHGGMKAYVDSLQG